MIKVEKPGRGDHYRRSRGGPVKAIPYQFLAVNSDKKSMTLDTWMDEGKEVFRDLVRESDVVLENFRAGVMDEMGIGYEALKRVNPGIVMTSISGWGAGNSLSRYAAHATVISAFGGMMAQGKMGDPKTRGRRMNVDTVTGVHAALGTLAALLGRQATGIGRHVDISMTVSIAGLISSELMFELLLGPSQDREQSGDDSIIPAFHDTYQAKDGWLYVQADLQGEWEHLAEGIDRPDLPTDPRFATERARSEHKAELDAIFDEWVSQRTMEEAFRKLGPMGVPCSQVHTVEDIERHPYLRERGFVHDVEDPRAGTVPLFGPRIQFTGEGVQAPRPAPDLGEHNAEILRGVLGYDNTKIDMLKKNKVV